MNIKFNAANAAKVSGKCQNVDNHSYAFNDGEIPSATERYIRGCVHKTAMRYALNDADAEDLAQEIYRAVYKRIREFDEARNAALTTFLHLCVDGAVREFLRSRRRLKNAKLVFTLDNPLPGNAEDGGDEREFEIDYVESKNAKRFVDLADLKHDIALVLAALEPKHRRVCELLMDGLSIPEAAERVGCSRQYVYSYVFPAFKKIFSEIS